MISVKVREKVCGVSEWVRLIWTLLWWGVELKMEINKILLKVNFLNIFLNLIIFRNPIKRWSVKDHDWVDGKCLLVNPIQICRLNSVFNQNTSFNCVFYTDCNGKSNVWMWKDMKRALPNPAACRLCSVTAVESERNAMTNVCC